MSHQIVIHADGACSGNPGPGGWAASIAQEGTSTLLLSGGHPHTTNNIMEMSAACAALEHVLASGNLQGMEVVLRLDSEYVLKGLKEWLPGWKRRGWKTASNGAVKNREIWEELDRHKTAIETFARLSLVHVRGHSGDPDNDRVDEAAVDARDRARSAKAPWSDAVRITVAEPGPEDVPGAAEIEQAGLARGFRRFECPISSRKNGYLFSMQKVFKEGQDTLFFASVDFWDLGEITRGAVHEVRGSVKAQFHTEDNREGEAIDVGFRFTGFEAAEVRLGDMWRRMEFGRYERVEPQPTISG